MKELVTGFKIKECKHSDTCEICIKGKKTKGSFLKKSDAEPSEILELIHSDVCGPISIN